MITIPDFELVEKVPEEVIEKYRTKVPEQMIEFWETYGFGTFQQGYLKSINPDEWVDVLQEVSKHKKGGIPLFITGMGGLVIWDGKSIYDFKIWKDDFDNISSGMKYFFRDLYADENWDMEENFKWQPYIEALEKYGSIAYDECFGYTPLLVLGGPEKVENLSKVKVREYMLLNISITGVIY